VILGGGKLELPPRGINARFGFTQAEGQKDYFISVCNSLSTISSAKYREYSYGCFNYFSRFITSLVGQNLNHWWVTGFADAESSFILSIYDSNKRKTGSAIKLIFSIKLHIKDLALLERIISFFGGFAPIGTITISERDGFAIYSVQSVEDLVNVIMAKPLIF
jgi:hypothetical protein